MSTGDNNLPPPGSGEVNSRENNDRGESLRKAGTAHRNALLALLLASVALIAVLWDRCADAQREKELEKRVEEQERMLKSTPESVSNEEEKSSSPPFDLPWEPAEYDITD